jgi:hypothetical protein
MNVQPKAMNAIPDGITNGPKRADWGTIVQFDSEFDKFPVGKVHGTWETGPQSGPALFGSCPDGNAAGGASMSRWIEPVRWYYGGQSQLPCWNNTCFCPASRFNMDGFERLWVPAVHTATVNVLDGNGNLIARIGRYGNYDSRGKDSPVVDPKTGLLRPKRADDPADLKPPRELSEDIGLVKGTCVAASDEALYVADISVGRIVRGKLTYKAEETVPVP